MRKLRLAICVLLLFAAVIFPACESERDIAIEYESGVFSEKDWDDATGTYSLAAIPDSRTAIAVAEAIFRGMEKSADMQDNAPLWVFFDEQDEIWIVTFGEEAEDGEVVVGGDCSIALRKQDGKVLRIWFGE